MDCFHLNWSALSLHCKEKENNIMLLNIHPPYMQSSPPVLTNQKKLTESISPLVIHTRCQAKIIDDTSRSIVMQCAFVTSIPKPGQFSDLFSFQRPDDIFYLYKRPHAKFQPPSSKPVDLYSLTTCRLQ